MENAIHVTVEEGEVITKYDFRKNDSGEKKLIYTKWGSPEEFTDVEDLGEKSLKINGQLGDIYIDKIRTDGWVIIGQGTTLHCDDIEAGEEIVTEYEGFIH